MECLLAFGSTHRALKAEGVLDRGSIPKRLLPAPPGLASHCALVISVDGAFLDSALAALKSGRVVPRAVYRREGDGFVKL
jgi:hypothetical protein